MFHFNFITVSQLNPSNGMERRLFFIVEIEGDEILMRASEDLFMEWRMELRGV